MQKQQNKNSNQPNKQNQNTTTTDTKQASQPFQNQTQTNAGDQAFSTTAADANGQRSRSSERNDQQLSDADRDHVPREINLPTGEKTNVAKEVYGGGQRPDRHQSSERAGTQFSVDPSTSTPRSALDDDYLAGEEADRKSMRNTSANSRPRGQGERTDVRRGQSQDHSPAP